MQNSRLDGLGILGEMLREEPQVPCVMISGHGTIETAVRAIQQGAYDFIEKPFNSDRLLLIVSRALEAARLKRENSELKLRAGAETELVGNSQPMAQLRAAIERVAPTGSRVLIAGPAGSGKEVAARMIHARSRRADGPFVALNCATLNPGRFEEELFGVEAPAPDSSVAPVPRRAGVLERAHGGTLLLDEVADMPLETQGKIVRALQEQGFERVGGSSRVKGDVRVLATTNRDLQAEIAAGRFREDLYYRLNVLPIRVPALRERLGDLEAISQTLGVAPTYVHRRGDLVGLSRWRRHEHDMWSYLAAVPEDRPLAVHLDALWRVVRPHLAYLKRLKERLTVDVFCGYRSNCSTAGFEVDHRSLIIFTELEVPFGVPLAKIVEVFRRIRPTCQQQVERIEQELRTLVARVDRARVHETQPLCRSR